MFEKDIKSETFHKQKGTNQKQAQKQLSSSTGVKSQLFERLVLASQEYLFSTLVELKRRKRVKEIFLKKKLH